MGLFRRAVRAARSDQVPEVWQQSATANLYDGDVDLEVVGEANYQEDLWSICGGRSRERVRVDVVVALVPEPSNPYDSNAISIQIDGRVVGYLSRDDAKVFRPAVERLMSESGAVVALRGVVVGGGLRDDGIGRLGVWLRHDPTDFGLQASDSAASIPLRGEPWAQCEQD